MSSVNPNSRRRSGTTRPTVLSAFARIEASGLQKCADCESDPLCKADKKPWQQPLFWPCEHAAVEHRLGRDVDADCPDDLAIGAALQIEGEHRAEVAADRESEIRAAHREGRLLSPDEKQRLTPRKQDEVSLQRHDDLLQHARALRKSEVANAAQTILMERQWGFLRGEAEPGLTPAESQTLQALQAGSGPSVLPDDLYRQAAKMVARRERRDRGELPTSAQHKTSHGRLRYPTFEERSFQKQLGRLAAERDENEIIRLVRELRRQAKQHGFLPPHHDRRTRR